LYRNIYGKYFLGKPLIRSPEKCDFCSWWVFVHGHVAVGGFSPKALCIWWIFRKSTSQFLDLSKKHSTFGGYLEKALCSWWIFRKSIPQLVDFH